MSAATEWENRPVRLTRDRTGIMAGVETSHRQIELPAGEVGTIQGPWVTDDGYVCESLMHMRVDAPDGRTVRLPVGEDDIEEVANDE